MLRTSIRITSLETFMGKDKHFSAVKLREEPGLSAKLWENSEDLAGTALKTQFIQGISKGNLNPIDYATFSLQDCIYGLRAIQTFKILSERASYLTTSYAEAVRALADHKQESYGNYFDTEFRKWHLDKNNPGVIVDGPLLSYVKYEEEVCTAIPDAIYTFIAVLPCLKLWSWLAQQIQDSATDNNIYKDWITGNLDYVSSAKKFETFIDDTISQYLNLEKALIVYRCGMIHECNFFLGACRQPLLVEQNLRELYMQSDHHPVDSIDYKQPLQQQISQIGKLGINAKKQKTEVTENNVVNADINPVNVPQKSNCGIQ